MKKLFAQIWDVKQEERTRVFLMSGLLFFLMTTYLMLKPVQSALFLVDFGPEQLPYIYMLIAFIVGGFTILYNRFTDRLDLNRVIIACYGLWIFLLIIFWWHIRIRTEGIAYLFYIWVSIFGVLTASQFWLTANYLFDAREAKRVFGIIGTGGTLGGITGSLLTKILVSRLHMENLLLFCAGFLTVSALLYISAWRIRPRETVLRRFSQKKKIHSGAFGLIMRSRYLTMLTVIIGLGMVISTIVDIQFKTITFEYYQDKNTLTGFFGLFFFLLSIFSLVLQTFFSGIIVRAAGLAGTLSLLPSIVLTGTLFFLLFPVLLPVIILRLIDGGLRNTINRSAVELSFLPVPSDIKRRTKAFIDMFIDRLARGIGGFIVLISTTVFALQTRHTAYIVAALTAVIIIMIRKFRAEYVNMFRSSLEKEKLDPVELNSQIRDPATIDIMLNGLHSPNRNQVLYLLPLIESIDKETALPHIARLLRHESPEVRHRAVTFLLEHDNGEYFEHIERLFNDDDVRCVNEAVRYYCMKSEGSLEEKLNRLLEDKKPKVIGAVIHFAGTYFRRNGSAIKADPLVEKLLNWSSLGDSDAKIEAVRALPFTRNRTLHKQLSRLFTDTNPDVLKQAILSAGKLGKREYVDSLINFLSNGETRPHAMNALTEYGNKIVGILCNHIIDDELDFIIRRNMIKILRDIRTSYALDGLIFCLETEEIPIRIHILRAINIMKANDMSVSHMHKELEEVLRFEVRYYSILAVIWTRIGFSAEQDQSMLRDALIHDVRNAYDRIFTTLELIYSQHDILNAYDGLSSINKSFRARAIEFLEHELIPEHRDAIIPILETARMEDFAALRKGWIWEDISDLNHALEKIFQMDNPILHVYALNYIIHYGIEGLENTIRELSLSSNNIVSETALKALSKTR